MAEPVEALREGVTAHQREVKGPESRSVHFDRRDGLKTVRRLMRRLSALGWEVELKRRRAS